MILYLTVKTNIADLVIDFIEVELANGKIVSLNWDESDIERLEDGFRTRHKGVQFNEEYANGQIDSLKDMSIECVGIYTEGDHDSDIIITEMIFEDNDKEYVPSHLLPYDVNANEHDLTA